MKSNDKAGMPFEEAAHIQTVTGWVCKTCGRFYGGSERCARYCCATTMHCDECGHPYRKTAYCEPCYRKRRDAKYESLPQVPWDGETPLATFDNDLFFFNADAIAEHLEDVNDGDEPRRLEDLKLVVCKLNDPRAFIANDFWNDYLGEDETLKNASEIEAIVNQWGKDNLMPLWYPGNIRPTLESVRAAIGDGSDNR